MDRHELSPLILFQITLWTDNPPLSPCSSSPYEIAHAGQVSFYYGILSRRGVEGSKNRASSKICSPSRSGWQEISWKVKYLCGWIPFFKKSKMDDRNNSRQTKEIPLEQGRANRLALSCHLHFVIHQRRAIANRNRHCRYPCHYRHCHCPPLSHTYTVIITHAPSPHSPPPLPCLIRKASSSTHSLSHTHIQGRTGAISDLTKPTMAWVIWGCTLILWRAHARTAIARLSKPSWVCCR